MKSFNNELVFQNVSAYNYYLIIVYLLKKKYLISTKIQKPITLLKKDRNLH